MRVITHLQGTCEARKRFLRFSLILASRLAVRRPRRGRARSLGFEQAHFGFEGRDIVWVHGAGTQPAFDTATRDSSAGAGAMPR